MILPKKNAAAKSPCISESSEKRGGGYEARFDEEHKLFPISLDILRSCSGSVESLDDVDNKEIFKDEDYDEEKSKDEEMGKEKDDYEYLH